MGTIILGCTWLHFVAFCCTLMHLVEVGCTFLCVCFCLCVLFVFFVVFLLLIRDVGIEEKIGDI